MAQPHGEPDFRTRLQILVPKLVLSPSIAMVLIFVYGFILFTVYVSFTDSRILPFVNSQGDPTYDLIGLSNYEKLFKLSHWEVAITNLGVFAGLYIIICCAIGLMLAIFLDQKIRG
ncbi:MAG: sugar ABC transporter permease, partial [Pseudomonadota bacterium]